MAPRPEEIGDNDFLDRRENEEYYRFANSLSERLKECVGEASERLKRPASLSGFLLDTLTSTRLCIHPVVGCSDRFGKKEFYALAGQNLDRLCEILGDIESPEGFRVRFPIPTDEEGFSYFYVDYKIVKPATAGGVFLGVLTDSDQELAIYDGSHIRRIKNDYLGLEKGNYPPASAEEITDDVINLMFVNETLPLFYQGLANAAGWKIEQSSLLESL